MNSPHSLTDRRPSPAQRRQTASARTCACALFVFAALLVAAAAAEAPRIEVDVSQAPECEAFARRSKAICGEWYPKINVLLNGTNQPLPYPTITLAFAPLAGVAATTANHITVSAEWVTRKAPDDYGMIVHELTHIVQDYQGRGEGWLTEGIADYIRDYCFEPGVRTAHVDPDKSSYRDGYGVTAAFLAWLEQHRARGIVGRLSRDSRAGTFTPAKFKEYAGQDVDELWRQFIATRRPKPAAGVTP